MVRCDSCDDGNNNTTLYTTTTARVNYDNANAKRNWNTNAKSNQQNTLWIWLLRQWDVGEQCCGVGSWGSNRNNNASLYMTTTARVSNDSTNAERDWSTA